MAAYRKVSVTFWNDGFVQSLTPEQKYFYLFLMTNTKTKQCGIYEITVSQMCFETGYNSETVNKLLSFFEKTGKVKWSKSTNEIALKNWPKYNASESPKVLACVESELKDVKNRVLIQYLYSMDTDPQETKEETEAKPKEEPKTETANVTVWPTFEDFWDKYGKKIDRPKCEKKWAKIPQGAREKIMQHLDAYIASTPEIKYRRDPTTYLNNESWNNEIVKNGNATKQITREQRIEYINAKYGPKGDTQS